jgi:hypothetical protein
MTPQAIRDHDEQQAMGGSDGKVCPLIWPPIGRAPGTYADVVFVDPANQSAMGCHVDPCLHG